MYAVAGKATEDAKVSTRKTCTCVARTWKIPEYGSGGGWGVGRGRIGGRDKGTGVEGIGEVSRGRIEGS